MTTKTYFPSHMSGTPQTFVGGLGTSIALISGKLIFSILNNLYCSISDLYIYIFKLVVFNETQINSFLLLTLFLFIAESPTVNKNLTPVPAINLSNYLDWTFHRKSITCKLVTTAEWATKSVIPSSNRTIIWTKQIIQYLISRWYWASF